MNIALIAHDRKKDDLIQFVIAYLPIFKEHALFATGTTGKLIAEAIAGTAERFDVFARLRHRDFPGGARLRRPIAAIGMLYYSLRDRL